MGEQVNPLQYGALPKVFYNNSELDLELFESIWKETGLNFRRLKALVRLDSNSSASDVDKVKVFAALCNRVEWRRSWYEDFKLRKKGMPRYLSLLVASLVKRRLSDLDTKGEAFSGFFTRSVKGRIYPKPEKVPEMADILSTLFVTDPRATALFVWTLFERSFLSSKSRGGALVDDELKSFPQLLLDSLIEKGCDELVKLITPVDSAGKRIEVERQVAEKSGTKNKAPGVDQIGGPKVIGDDPELNLAKSQLAAVFLQSSKELEIKRKLLLNLCADLNELSVIQTTSKKVRAKLEELEQLLEDSKAQVRNTCDFIFLRMSALKILKPLPKSWLDFQLPSSKEIEQSDFNQKFESLNKLVRLDSALSRLSSETIEKHRDQLEYSLNLDMSDAIRDVDEKLVWLVRYDGIHTKLLDTFKYLSAVSMDAEWIATEDLRMDEYWPSIALSNLEKSPLDDLTWMYCRKALDVDYEAVSEAAIKILLSSLIDNFIDVCSKLSFLEAYQLQRLTADAEELYPAAVLSQLFKFLVAIKNQDERKFDFWSSWPLQYYAKDPGDTSNPPLDRLVSAVFTESAEDDGIGILNELNEIASEIAIQEKAEVLNIAEIAWQELESLLQYRAHGEGNYAALWKTAYKDCIEGLKYFTQGSDLYHCASGISSAIDEIDVNTRYYNWLKVLQHSVYSESQYEAATKVYVAGRLAKIKNWCDRFGVQPLESLSSRHSLRDILISIEYNVDKNKLQAWVDFAAKTLSVDSYEQYDRHSNEQDRDSRIIAPVTVDMPRSYLDRLSGIYPDWKKIVSDHLASLAGSCTPTNLWGFYRAEKSLEAQEHLWKAYPDDIPEADTRGLIQDLHLSSLKLAVKISDLRTLFSNYAVDQQMTLLQRKMDLAFEAREWTKCELNIAVAAELVQRLESKKREETERALLIRDVVSFGGDVVGDEDNFELAVKLDDLVSSSSNRRIHIGILSAFSETKNLSTVLSDESTRVSKELCAPSLLPSAEDSKFLAEIWGALLNPIAEQLKRPQVLVPSYKSMLELLALHCIGAMSNVDSIFSRNDGFISACIDCGASLEEAGSVGELTIIIRRFSADAGLMSLAEALDNLVSGDHDYSFDNLPDLGHRPPGQSLADTSPELSSSEILDVGKVLTLVDAWLRRHVQVIGKTKASYHDAMHQREWMQGLAVSYAAVLEVSLSNFDNNKTERDAFLAAVICALNLPEAVAESESPLAIGLLTIYADAGPVQWAHTQKGILGSSLILDALGYVFLRWANREFSEAGGGKNEFRNSVGSAIRELGEQTAGGIVPRREALVLFGYAPNNDFPSAPVLKLLWDAFTGDKQQAEVRAGLMLLLFKVGLYRHVGLCFTFSPIDIERRLALAYSQLLQNSDSIQGRETLENIRGASQAKPFVIFAQSVLTSLSRNQGLPAEIEFSSPLERSANKRAWVGVLTITPRSINPPLDIEIELPGDGVITFSNGRKKIKFSGPFFEPREERLELLINSPELRSTTVRARCEFVTIEEKHVVADVDLVLAVATLTPFIPVSSEQLEKSFSGFPQFQMRGLSYVPRDADEKRIESTLFNNERAGSVWISSPRRSGKTTMLFRILDGFSHKVGRDNAIIFLSMDKGFQTVKDFNHWLWSRVQSNDENAELRDLIEDFSRIGERLPFDAGADVFISALAKEIISKSSTLTRVYFLLDEIDKLAEMSLSKGDAKSVANEITWQFRHIISSQPNIGMVFCGSNPARTMFVRNPEAALYNSIQNFDLTPFGMGSELEKRRSREIVEPAQLRGRYKVPDKTLEFLIKVTAGIPYYMKLVAGATYAVSQQTYLMNSDVIHGLTSLLEKSTGVTALDSLDDPGEDELRVLYSREERDQMLIRAVLYAAADIRSPVSGGTLMVGELRSERSPLVARYNLTRADITSGVESAIQLGYLKRHKELAALEFSIPMLGESIRHRSGALWAIINDKLEQLVSL